MENQKIFKPYKGNEPFIFVSYNHDDAEVVYRIEDDSADRKEMELLEKLSEEEAGSEEEAVSEDDTVEADCEG